MIVPFVGGTYQMDALSFGVQRSINLYPIISEIDTNKSKTSLRSTAGLSLLATAGGGPIRGCISSTSGRAFVVSGTGFYEYKADMSTTLIGSINTFTTRVSIAENNGQIIIVDGQDGWIFDKNTDAFTQITDPDFPTCSIVSYQDGYFLTFEDGTQKFYVSAIEDGTSWDALDFTTVQSSPDNLTGIISDNGNVWLFGNRSTEVYQNTGGGSGFPFRRIGGAIIQTGCANGFTVQKFDNSIVWLGQDEQGTGVVWRANGYNAVRVSNKAIESRIEEATDYTDSYAWVYHEQGGIFYCLQIKGLDTTLVLDAATGQWHERDFLDTDTNTRQQHRGSCHMFFDQKNIVCDRANGNIYEQSLSIYDYAGSPMVKERTSPHYDDQKSNIIHNKFELDMEVGVGLTTGQGDNPQAMLQYSDDGGFTYGNELWTTIGKKGEYRTRVEWRRLGVARDRVYKLRISDPVQIQINEAYLNGV
jgi:hypothetical protein